MLIQWSHETIFAIVIFEIGPYVVSFWGLCPRPPPGLCLWTLLGYFRLTGPLVLQLSFRLLCFRLTTRCPVRLSKVSRNATWVTPICVQQTCCQQLLWECRQLGWSKSQNCRLTSRRHLPTSRHRDSRRHNTPVRCPHLTSSCHQPPAAAAARDLSSSVSQSPHVHWSRRTYWEPAQAAQLAQIRQVSLATCTLLARRRAEMVQTCSAFSCDRTTDHPATNAQSTLSIYNCVKKRPQFLFKINRLNVFGMSNPE